MSRLAQRLHTGASLLCCIACSPCCAAAAAPGGVALGCTKPGGNGVMPKKGHAGPATWSAQTPPRQAPSPWCGRGCADRDPASVPQFSCVAMQACEPPSKDPGVGGGVAKSQLPQNESRSVNGSATGGGTAARAQGFDSFAVGVVDRSTALNTPLQADCASGVGGCSGGATNNPGGDLKLGMGSPGGGPSSSTSSSRPGGGLHERNDGRVKCCSTEAPDASKMTSPSSTAPGIFMAGGRKESAPFAPVGVQPMPASNLPVSKLGSLVPIWPDAVCKRGVSGALTELPFISTTPSEWVMAAWALISMQLRAPTCAVEGLRSSQRRECSKPRH
mmetsp:Transcript_108301/g.345888  ORF Transcript_108301/g.345888 Transcript_108301/m.345888 type:complete len:331 (-) Transcript_108301:7-999(-)